MGLTEKRVYIETYGCQMNEHDSELILRLLEGLNYSETKEAKEADLIFINTCSVREKPEHKVYSALGRFKRLKENKGTIIGVTGCVAQQEGERLLERIPYLDLVIGTQAISIIPQLLDRLEITGQRICEVGLYPQMRYIEPSLAKRSCRQVKSYVTIMQGCDHFCSFCIVPYVRGRERSRPSRDIIEEIKNLSEMGVKEVFLLGQNVNSYGKGLKEELAFPALLREINDIKGIERIRFTTSHPVDLSEELIKAFSVLDKLCEHIHLPVQSGSNRILKAMHRGYTRESYLEKVEELRRTCPSIAITSDVIVGFPGEDDQDFRDTIDLIENVQFDDLYSFKYSPRKGTRAAQFENQIEEEVKKQRLNILQRIQKEITIKKNKLLEGRIEEVLVEGQSKQSDKDLTGRTRSNKIVNFEGDIGLVGRLVPVKILKAYPHSIRGEIEIYNPDSLSN